MAQLVFIPFSGSGGGGGGPPSGPAGGDLGGTYPNPDVTGIQTIPVSSTAPIQAQVLQYSGVEWHPAYKDYIIWRPGGVSLDDVVVTWAEVETYIAATTGHMTVFVDTTLAPAIIPATASTECFGALTIQPYTFDLTGSGGITVADGGQLKNLFTLRTAGISGTPTIRPFILMDKPGSLLICREGGSISLEVGSTVSAIQQSADFCELAQFEGASVSNNSGNAALPLYQIDPGLTCLHAIIALAGTSGPPAYADNIFGGDATTTLLQIYDASGSPVVQPNFLGTAVALPMDFAVGVVYNDTTVPVPSLGVDTVQAAIDVLKVQVAALVPGSYRASFTDADLVLGILTVVHNLGVRYNTWAIYDNNSSAVLNPDSAIDVDGNTLTFDLSTYQIVNGGAIPGTWNVVVQS